MVRTRPRCEKKLDNYCCEQGILSYLPLLARSHRYGGRERTFSSPLFPGYLFCLVADRQWQLIDQNRFKARILTVHDQEDLINQLLGIQTALMADEVTEVFPFLVEGNPVRIVNGRLRGVEGVVQRLKGKTRVVINVEMIQQSIAMEVDGSDLQPA